MMRLSGGRLRQNLRAWSNEVSSEFATHVAYRFFDKITLSLLGS